MVRTGHGRQLGRVARGLPGVVEHLRLARELARLGAAPGEVDRRRARPHTKRGRVAADHAVVELDLRLQVAVAQRRQVVQPADQHCRLERIGRQPVVFGPAGLQRHRRQVTARRVAADRHAGRVAAVFMDVLQHPGQRRAGLARDLVDRHRRAQRVVDQHGRDAQRLQPERDAGELLGRQRPPVAAVDEDEHGRVRLFGGKDVERLGQRRPVAHVLHIAQRGPRPLRLRDEVLHLGGGIGHRQRGVVLGVDLRLVGEFAVDRGVVRGHGRGSEAGSVQSGTTAVTSISTFARSSTSALTSTAVITAL